MSTQLCIDNNVDELVDIVIEDAGVDSGTDAHDSVSNLAFQIAQLRMELNSSAFVETTDDDVIITVKIPRT